MNHRLGTILAVLFFLVLLIVGILIYKDFGIPWDEPLQINIAHLNQDYIFHHDPALLSFRDKYYGMVFELPILWITQATPLPRHLLLFLVFIAGLIVLYFLAKRLFQSAWWALLATALMAASPRMFADAFYNSKDIPFLLIGIVAVFTLVLLSDAIRTGRRGGTLAGLLILHSLTSAAMIGTRVPGVYIVLLTFIALVIDFIQYPPSIPWMILLPVVYLGLTFGVMVLVWPVLWPSPLHEFLAAFDKMSRLPYDISMLFMGKYIYASKLPWNYLPVWVGITSPLVVVAGFLPGLLGWMRIVWSDRRESITDGSLHRRLLSTPALNWTLVILWLAVPVAAVYKFHSVYYDGWRHMFFIYPPILLIGVLGLKTIYEWLMRWITARRALTAAFALFLLAGLVEPVWFMVRNHPYENVYFNALAGDPARLRSRFEMDYWGISYKQGIDYILATDPRPSISISVANTPGDFYMQFGLSAAEQSRVVVVKDPQQSDYFVSNFRWHPEDYTGWTKVYSARVRGVDIMAVYKIH